jgi:sec-independent protein translocase protein TatA
MPLSGIGFGEMLLIAMLVLLVFGPRRLPEITRSMGKAIREFKRGMNEIRRELEVADRQERWNRPATSGGGAGARVGAAAAVGAGASAAGATVAGTPVAADGAAPTEPVIAPPVFGSDNEGSSRSGPEAPVPVEAAEKQGEADTAQHLLFTEDADSGKSADSGNSPGRGAVPPASEGEARD